MEYATTTVKNHPRVKSGKITVHVVIAERALGQPLPIGVEVHHVDENKRNNANRNLVICQDAGYHKLLHARARIVRAGGDPDTQRICSICRALLNRDAFNRNRASRDGLAHHCRECGKSYLKTYQRRHDYVRPARSPQ